MPETCPQCGRRRARRSCPALGVSICSRCCGADRLVRIACPPTCAHLKAHEPFQLKRQGERYRDAWLETVRGVSEEEARALGVLERCLMAAVADDERATDDDLERVLEELDSLLSPIEIIAGPPAARTRTVLSEVERALGSGLVSRDALRAAIPRVGLILTALRDPAAPRAFLRGLAAWVASRPAASPPPERSGLIVTPQDLREGQ